jgi:hypothetical protein
MATNTNSKRLFTKLLTERSVSRTKSARQTYRNKARNIKRNQPGTRPNQVLREARTNKLLKPTLKGKLMIGNMYMFQYDPKLKEELPYYDEFPLVFPFQPLSDGFIGINMHYLFPKYRAILMDRLYPLLRNKKYDETTRLRLSYDLLNGAKKYKYFKPCIHRYLTTHVESRFIQVPIDEWDFALFLPTERFVGAKRRTVWADSRSNFI